jgi:nucleoporin NUP159
LLRLKDFPPNLQDVILVASTASIDIGLFSKSKVPLTSNKPADKITGVFTMTEMSDDSRRAQLPMNAELMDTSPIGFALDLSSKDKVPKPIPADEIDESPTPLPALMVLNNEGVLASWWVIYSESIRQGTVYPGLVVAGGASQATQASPAPTQTPQSAFGASSKPAFGAPAFGSASSSAFGAPSVPETTGGAFGGPSALGKSQSPWGTPSTSAAPSTNTFGTFGAPSAVAATKPAFGAPSFGTTSTPTFGLGNRASPWATGGSTAPNAAFGQAGGLATSAPVFGAAVSTTSSPAPSTGFAAFASKGGFASAGAAVSPNGSVFGSKSTSTTFASPSAGSINTASVFGGNTSAGSIGTAGIFGRAANKVDVKPAFGSGGFVLGSTFKADPNATNDVSEASTEPKGSLFGGGFGKALEDSSKKVEAPVSQETDMDSDDTPRQEVPATLDPTTPSPTPAAAKTQVFGSTSTPVGGLFGTSAPSSTPTAKPASTGFSFGQQTTDKPQTAGFNFASINTASSVTPTTAKIAAPEPVPEVVATPASPPIKEEPAPETPPLSEKTPEAPLPPDSTSKTSYAAGESSASSVEPDAPLPPDFLPKAAFKDPEPPKPPSLGLPAEKPIVAHPDSPADIPGGPDDEGDDESDFLSEEEGGGESQDPSEEGSGEDVAKDMSPTSEANQTPGFTPQSSFGGTKNRGQESNMFTKIDRPGEAQTQRSLFGEINRSTAPILPPPRIQQSPRSPSPIRTSVPSRMRPDASRSVSAPGAALQASQILGSQRLGGRSMMPTQNLQAASRVGFEQQAETRHRDNRARKEEEEMRTLQDEADDNAQAILASDIEITKTLAEFIAHADYVGDDSMQSIPAQVEAVYRDINSMIDTLGLNARSLKGFTEWHTDSYKEVGRTIEDLEPDEPDDWCLVEVEGMSNLVERKLTDELEECRVKDLVTKLESCNDLQKDMIRLRAKHEDIKKIIDFYRDPTHQAIARAQPLSAEQAAQQHDLRRDFTKFQKLLTEAEESVTVLKAKIVSQATSNAKANGSTGPTVEAVMRTIAKMTSMAEKRSGDIDVLEGQMRRLRFSSTISAGSREGSPFATPQNNRTSVRNTGTSSTYGLFYTPESIKDTPQRFQNSLMSSVGSHSRSSPPRKKLSGYSTEEKAQLKMKLARRKEVTNKLKAALQKNGTNVRLMVDDDD